jgi:CheY-like chemotaxis protein
MMTNSKRILLVEDDEDVAALLAETLQEWGHSVGIAHDARTALETVPQLDPEVAFVDLGLPDLDGLELGRRLRALRPAPSLQLFALTGYSRDSDRREARDAGFDHYLVKPIMPDDLRRALDQLEGNVG